MSMNDERFDELLSQDLENIHISCDIVKKVTPWSVAAKYLIGGFLIMLAGAWWRGIGYHIYSNRVWIGLLGDAHILVCLAFYFLGFQCLRKVNHWFTACWYLNLWITVSTLLELGFYRLPDTASIFPEWMLSWTEPCMFLFLWRGILGIQRMAGQSTKGSPATRLMLCYILAILSIFLENIFNYIPYSPTAIPGVSLNWLEMFPFIFAHFILLITFAVLASLWELSKKLDQIGYLVKPIPTVLSMKVLILFGCGIVLLLRLICKFFFQVPMF